LYSEEKEAIEQTDRALAIASAQEPEYSIFEIQRVLPLRLCMDGAFLEIHKEKRF
jgi:hypothetical protein